MVDELKHAAACEDGMTQKVDIAGQADVDLKDADLEKVSGGIGFLRSGPEIILADSGPEPVSSEAAFKI